MKVFNLLVRMWEVVDYSQHKNNVCINNFILGFEGNNRKGQKTLKYINNPEGIIGGFFQRNIMLYYLPTSLGLGLTNILYLLIGIAIPSITSIIQGALGIKGYGIFIFVTYSALIILFTIPPWLALNKVTNDYRPHYKKYDNYSKNARRKVIWSGFIIRWAILLSPITTFLSLVYLTR